MQNLKLAAILVDVPLPHLSINGPGDAIDESSLEKLLQDLEDFLQDVLLFCIFVAVFLFTKVRLFLLIPLHTNTKIIMHSPNRREEDEKTL